MFYFSIYFIFNKGCLSFRKLCIENSTKNEIPGTGIDPFLHSLTIAQYCNIVYRYKHLIEETICVIPDNGLNPKQKTSNKCVRWLGYTELTTKSTIQQASSIGGEKKIGNYFCDGFDEKNKIIYEFLGCYW
jgi:hypothetical protein